MSDANKRQVGGGHYKTRFEHWDFVIECLGNRYLEGQITKYVTRWRKKNGLQDLEKAIHFADKLIEANVAYEVRPIGSSRVLARRSLAEYFDANDIRGHDADVIRTIATWTTMADLTFARSMLGSMANAERQRLNHEQAVKAGAAPLPGIDRPVTDADVFDGDSPAEPGRGYVAQE
jgi:hypothetical protein